MTDNLSEQSIEKQRRIQVALNVVFTIIAFLILAFAIRSSRASAQGLGNCGEFTFKDEQFPFGFTLPNGIVKKLVIKAGSQNQGDACFEFIQDGDDGCYSVSGLGTASASATKIGEGPECKDISHVEFTGEDPTPTPSPSASPSATPSPTPDPSPSPTPTPETKIEDKPIEKQVEQVRQEYIQEHGAEPQGIMK